uniref:Uncharacterized protein n=1 Tax=Triticum urartu TaxID=4572 RepID=A0A8R7U0W9_TRIUA
VGDLRTCHRQPQGAGVQPPQGVAEPVQIEAHVLAAEVHARDEVPPAPLLRRLRVAQHHVVRRVLPDQRALVRRRVVLLVLHPHHRRRLLVAPARHGRHTQRRHLQQRGAARPEEEQLRQVRAVHARQHVARAHRRVLRRQRRPVRRLQDRHVEPHRYRQPRHRRLVLDHPRALARVQAQPRAPPPLLGRRRRGVRFRRAIVLVRAGEEVVEVDQGPVVPGPSRVDGENAVEAAPHDGAREAVRALVVQEVDHVVAREPGHELRERAGPPRVVHEHGKDHAPAEVLHRQPRRQEPVVERVEQVPRVPARRHHQRRRVVPHVAPVPVGLVRPGRAEPHLLDVRHHALLPLARVGPHHLLLLRHGSVGVGVGGAVGRRVEQQREGRGVRAHVAGHEAHVGVVVRAVAADAMASHGRARGAHLVVEDQRLALIDAAAVHALSLSFRCSTQCRLAQPQEVDGHGGRQETRGIDERAHDDGEDEEEVDETWPLTSHLLAAAAAAVLDVHGASTEALGRVGELRGHADVRLDKWKRDGCSSV